MEMNVCGTITCFEVVMFGGLIMEFFFSIGAMCLYLTLVKLQIIESIYPFQRLLP